jgi:hypothetical protein
MSGVPAPQYPITEPFGAAAVAPVDITLPIPVPSQAGVLVGAASFADGFPPATRTDPETGGQPPYGEDMNGILFMMSVYCALMQAGQIVPFNTAAATAFGGYAIGANVAMTNGEGFWFNTVDGNTDDPEGMSPAGWIGWSPAGVSIGYVLATVPAGTSNDFDPVDFSLSTNTLDLDPNAGASTINSLVAGHDGQRIVVTNVNGANNLKLAFLTGPTPANQFRGMGADITLVPNNSITIQYSAGVSKWLVIP